MILLRDASVFENHKAGTDTVCRCQSNPRRQVDYYVDKQPIWSLAINSVNSLPGKIRSEERKSD